MDLIGTNQKIEDYLKTLSDDKLLDKLTLAGVDLQEAAEKQKNSEWHEECFAGYVVFCNEAKKRGLSITPNATKQARVFP